MKIVIAIDSFKGSLTSYEAAIGVRDAAVEVFNDPEIIILPIADGGEGTAKALTEGLSGEFRSVKVTGPLGEKVFKIHAAYFIKEKRFFASRKIIDDRINRNRSFFAF